MENIDVSVIIPVYGVEKYIRQCLESVIDQTLKSIEIIVVNDGTKDNSMKIVEEYLNDRRIKIINKENGGQSSARNAGLKEAKGEYISFIDSDDFIEKTMLEELFLNSEKKMDIVFSDMILYNNITKNYTNRIIENDKNIFLGKGTYLWKLCGMEVCNKIYKRDFLLKNKIFFKEGIIHEDNLFTLESFFKAQEVKYVKRNHYFYRLKRENSTLNSLVKEKRIEAFKTILESIEDFQLKFEGNILEKIRLQLGKLEQKSLLFRVTYNKEDAISKKEILEIKEEIRKNWNVFSEVEKYLLRRDMIDLLESKACYNINLFDKFYWKNKMITSRAFRRILRKKIVNIFQ